VAGKRLVRPRETLDDDALRAGDSRHRPANRANGLDDFPRDLQRLVNGSPVSWRRVAPAEVEDEVRAQRVAVERPGVGGADEISDPHGTR
jgi:hypothetical protein